MANQRPSQTPAPIPNANTPFESENVMAEEAARVLAQQRKSSGGLEDSSTENPVKNDQPFKTGRKKT